MRMKPLTVSLLLTVLSVTCAAPTAWAQSSSASAQPVNDALYQSLGGQAGLKSLMDDFMRRLLADPRMNPFFKDVDQAHVKAQLVAQFCEVAGGPCKLKGPDRKSVV